MGFTQIFYSVLTSIITTVIISGSLWLWAAVDKLNGIDELETRIQTLEKKLKVNRSIPGDKDKIFLPSDGSEEKQSIVVCGTVGGQDLNTHSIWVLLKDSYNSIFTQEKISPAKTGGWSISIFAGPDWINKNAWIMLVKAPSTMDFIFNNAKKGEGFLRLPPEVTILDEIKITIIEDPVEN